MPEKERVSDHSLLINLQLTQNYSLFTIALHLTKVIQNQGATAQILSRVLWSSTEC